MCYVSIYTSVIAYGALDIGCILVQSWLSSTIETNIKCTDMSCQTENFVQNSSRSIGIAHSQWHVHEHDDDEREIVCKIGRTLWYNIWSLPPSDGACRIFNSLCERVEWVASCRGLETCANRGIFRGSRRLVGMHNKTMPFFFVSFIAFQGYARVHANEIHNAAKKYFTFLYGFYFMDFCSPTDVSGSQPIPNIFPVMVAQVQ